MQNALKENVGGNCMWCDVLENHYNRYEIALACIYVMYNFKCQIITLHGLQKST